MSPDKTQNILDFETLITDDGKGKNAKIEALERLTTNGVNHSELLKEILEVIVMRTNGKSIVYSDRLTIFIPKIKQALKK